MFRCVVKGDFNKTKRFLRRNREVVLESLLKQYAEEGVKALQSATPVRTGKTANSWTYDIIREKNKYSISFSNSNVQDGVSIAIILEYGHATGWGAYVQGRHYIAPAIRPVFDKLADAAWKEVNED